MKKNKGNTALLRILTLDRKRWINLLVLVVKHFLGFLNINSPVHLSCAYLTNLFHGVLRLISSPRFYLMKTMTFSWPIHLFINYFISFTVLLPFCPHFISSILFLLFNVKDKIFKDSAYLQFTRWPRLALTHENCSLSSAFILVF